MVQLKSLSKSSQAQVTKLKFPCICSRPFLKLSQQGAPTIIRSTFGHLLALLMKSFFAGGLMRALEATVGTGQLAKTVDNRHTKANAAVLSALEQWATWLSSRSTHRIDEPVRCLSVALHVLQAPFWGSCRSRIQSLLKSWDVRQKHEDGTEIAASEAMLQRPFLGKLWTLAWNHFGMHVKASKPQNLYRFSVICYSHFGLINSERQRSP